MLPYDNEASPIIKVAVSAEEVICAQIYSQIINFMNKAQYVCFLPLQHERASWPAASGWLVRMLEPWYRCCVAYILRTLLYFTAVKVIVLLTSLLDTTLASLAKQPALWLTFFTVSSGHEAKVTEPLCLLHQIDEHFHARLSESWTLLHHFLPYNSLTPSRSAQKSNFIHWSLYFAIQTNFFNCSIAHSYIDVNTFLLNCSTLII